MQTNSEQLNNPEQNNKLQEMLRREQQLKKLVKRALLGVGILSAVLLIAGFLFFDSSSVKAPEQVAEADESNATTASKGFKGSVKDESAKEEKFNFDMKKYALDLFDFSEKPDLEDKENGIEYLFIDSETAFEGSMGYSANVDNNSPFRIVAIGLPAKTLSGTAASCYTGLKLDENDLPIDNSSTSEEDKVYKVLLPTTKEIEVAMQEEVDRVISKIVEDGVNEVAYDERREDIRAAAEVRRNLYERERKAENTDKKDEKKSNEPIQAQVAVINEEKKNKKSKKYLHSYAKYDKV